jgi:hypothetical protein
MFRALYRQIVRFFDWVNRSGSGSSSSRAVKEAEDHRRNIEDRYAAARAAGAPKGAAGLRCATDGSRGARRGISPTLLLIADTPDVR